MSICSHMCLKILLHLHTVELTDPTTVQERNCTLQIIFERWMKIIWFFFENRKLRSHQTAIPAIYEWETEEGNIYGAFSNYFSIDIERSSWKIWKTKNLSKLSMTTETQHRKVERRSHDIIKWKKSTFSCLRNFTTFLVLAPMKNKIWKKSIPYSARHLNPTFLYGGFFNLNEVTRAK